MKVFKKLKNDDGKKKSKKLEKEEVHSETTEHPGQKETWLREKIKRPKVNIDEENLETRAVAEESNESATDDKASECSQVNTQPSEIKHDLTIRELDTLKERIMPLMPGKEIEWVIITRDITNTLTITDKKAMLQIMCKNLEHHADALAKIKILLVHTAQRPDQYPNPLEEFYAWLMRRYKCTARQQLIKFKSLLQNMRWSWEVGPVDQILEIMHEVHFTWDDVENNDALRDEIKAFIGGKMDISTYSTLCEKPVKEWHDEITNIWRILKIKELVEKDSNEKPINNTRLAHRQVNDNGNEGVTVLNVEAKSGRLYKKDNKRPKKRCPRCRRGIHPIQNCPLPRKKGKGSRERNKIKRQKFGIGITSGKRGERRVACFAARSMPNGM